MLLERLNLLENEKILAISSFHPVLKTKRPRIGGGIFLSVKEVKKYDGAVVFFDESNELERNLKRSLDGTLIEVKTKGKNPFKVLEENLKALSPYLEKCDEKISEIKSWAKKIKKSYSEKKKKTWIFFLGKLETSDYPELIVSNDLFVKFLRESKFISTYESDLSYTNLAEKFISIYKNHQIFGLYEAKSEELEVKTVSEKRINLGFRGIFSHGFRQIVFLEKLKGHLNEF